MPTKHPKIKKALRYVFFTILFVVLAAFCLGIIFYASGYQINWKAGKIQKTGLLIIDYKEDGLQVSLNGSPVELNSSRTPGLISARYGYRVLPGDYDLGISRAGFLDYKTQVKINPELITRIEDLILIPKDIPELNILSSSLSYSVSEDGSRVIFQKEDGGITIYNTAQRTEAAVNLGSKKADGPVTFHSWSSDGSKVILKTAKNEFLVLDIDNPSASYFLADKFASVPAFDELFFATKNNMELLGRVGGKLYRMNISNASVTEIEKDIANLVANGGVFYFYDAGSNNFIQFDPNIGARNVLLENFKPAKDLDVLSLNNKDVYINDSGKLYAVVDKNNLANIDGGVTYALISGDQKTIYYIKSYEIWSYDITSKQSSIVTRFSKNINKIAEASGINYLYYLTDAEIGLLQKSGKENQVVKTTKLSDIKVIDKDYLLVNEVKDSQTRVSLWELKF